MSFFTPDRILVILIVALLLGGVALAGVQPAAFNTDGAEWDNGIWQVDNQLSKTEYATSWVEGEGSETISGQGHLTALKEIGFLPFTWMWYYRYTFNIEGSDKHFYPYSSTTGAEPIVSPSGETTYWFSTAGQSWDPTVGFPNPLEAFHVELQGELTARLKVYVEGMFLQNWPPGGTEWEVGQDTMYVIKTGWDGAFLKSGRGEIYLYGNQGPFEIGQTVQLFVRTGFAAGDKWYVKLYPPVTRPELFDAKIIQEIGNDKQLIVPIVIQEGWFVESGNYEDNVFKVELWNKFFEAGFEQIFTIDQLSRAPGQPVLSWDYVPSSLDTVTITAFSEATYTDINRFIVWAWYGDRTMPSTADTESWVKFEERHIATAVDANNYTATFELMAKNKDGTIVVKVIATDIDGRSSTPTFLSFVVEQGQMRPGDPLGQPFIWGLIVFILLFVGLIIGAIVAFIVYQSSNSIAIAVLAFFLIFGSFSVAAFVAGATPSIALSIGAVLQRGFNAKT